MKKQVLNAMTVAELKALAKSEGIRLSSRSKADIIDELQKGLRKMRQSKRASAKGPALKKSKGAITEKRVSGKPKAVKIPTKQEALALVKKDLAGMTIPALKEIAGKLGLKCKSRRKGDIVSELAVGLRKLRASARKSAKLKSGKSVGKQAPASMKKPPAVRKRTDPELSTRKPSRRKPGKVRIKEVTGLPEKEPYVLGTVPPRVPEVSPAVGDIPPIELLAAIAVDPQEIFISWEFAERSLSDGQPLLRVYESGTGKPWQLDIPLPALSGSAYVLARPGRKYYIEAGVVEPSGDFTAVRRSNAVATPPAKAQPLAEQSGSEKAGARVKPLPDEYFVYVPSGYGSR